MILETLHTYQTAFWWIGVLSVLTFLATILVIPLIFIHIPADYFVPRKRKKSASQGRYPPIHFLSRVFKNLFGIIFILTGLAMVILPGQGIIAILIGIMMVDFPGKFALERRIVQHPPVLRAINWMRTKANRQELQILPRGCAGAKGHEKRIAELGCDRDSP
jgi:hypothetical protein